MDREAFIETLGQYMGEDDLKRAKSMLEMTESEFIAQECKKINVPGIPQNLVANVFLRTHTSRDCGYVIADILIENKSGDDSDYTIEVEIDHATSFTVRGHVAGKRQYSTKSLVLMIVCSHILIFLHIVEQMYLTA